MRYKITFAIGVLVLLLLSGVYALNYLGFLTNDKGLNNFERVLVNPDNSLNKNGDEAEQEEKLDLTIGSADDLIVKEVVTGLDVPWSIVFTSFTRMLVTERPGQIVGIIDYKVQENPLYVFSDAAERSESGLMGMVLDPDYRTNKYIYVCYTYVSQGKLIDKVVRLKDVEEEGLVDETIIVDNIPAASNHAGCKVKIGPDNKLYITTGDATQRSIAQDLNNLGGKILRVNLDGSVPDDNPFDNSIIYSLGHRNPQGLDWASTGVMVSAEHGPSGFDGPGGGDEINIIKPGKNYGWPIVSHEQKKEGLESSLLVFTPAIAPSALMVYKGNKLSGFKNNIFVAMLKGEGVLRIVLNQDNTVNFYEKLKVVGFGRVREIIQGPDGYIYFTTSNRDGRGSPREKDDKIYKIFN